MNKQLRRNWLKIVLALMMSAGVSNGYWLTMLNITNLKGNMFVNGIILGSSEMIASALSGLLISLTSAHTAFRSSLLVAVMFNLIFQFLVPHGSFSFYFCLTLAILGIGSGYAA